MKTEREKMLAGELYNAGDAELCAARARARRLLPGDQSQQPDEGWRNARCASPGAVGLGRAGYLCGI